MIFISVSLLKGILLEGDVVEIIVSGLSVAAEFMSASHLLPGICI